MSDEQPELKAGHPPAVKAGGMRITQHKPPKEHSSTSEKERKTSGGSGGDDDEEYPVEKQKKEPTQLLISGAPARGDKDFPPEAIKAYHEKPHPTIEKVPQNYRGGINSHQNIQQPR